MPIIDYFNHRFQAEGYAVQTTPPPPSMRVFGIPDPKTREVSVRYNLYDPVDTFLFYGFVDTNSPWLASVPLKMSLPDGRSLEVLNIGGAVKKQLPPGLKDLRLYMPGIYNQNEQKVTLNKLLIPGQSAPRALQRVLASVLKTRYGSLSRDDIMTWVKELESEVLEVNRQWWKELSEMVQTMPFETPVAQNLRTLCDWSAKHLETYIAKRPVLK